MCENEHTVHIIIPPNMASEVLTKVDEVYLRDCFCREREQNCPKTEWEVCLLFGDAAPEDLIGTRKISVSEAEEVLKTTTERNVVYTLFLTENDHRLTELCSCCNCCCRPILEKRREGKYGEYLRSNYVAVTDATLCQACGLCETSCPFDARVVEDWELLLIDERCFGCGRCLNECPEDAISLEFQAGRGQLIPRMEI